MVRLLFIVISLFLFACGTKKKTKLTERSRSEQRYSASADSSYRTTSESERATRTVTDSTGTVKRTFSNVQGTFAADGSFTGTAESVTDERRDSKTADSSSNERNKQGSDRKGSNQVAMSGKQDDQKEQLEEERKPPDPVKTFGYTMAAGIAFLVLSFLAYLVYRYRDSLKTLLNRISNFFKSK